MRWREESRSNRISTSFWLLSWRPSSWSRPSWSQRLWQPSLPRFEPPSIGFTVRRLRPPKPIRRATLAHRVSSPILQIVPHGRRTRFSSSISPMSQASDRTLQPCSSRRRCLRRPADFRGILPTMIVCRVNSLRITACIAVIDSIKLYRSREKFQSEKAPFMQISRRGLRVRHRVRRSIISRHHLPRHRRVPAESL